MTAMRIINLNATDWKTVTDFYDAVLAAVGAPKWHGVSPDALIDSMVFGGINSVEPPYAIRISGTANLPPDVREELEVAKEALEEGRKDFRGLKGRDVEVGIEIEP